jgi:hypothetical protein
VKFRTNNRDASSRAAALPVRVVTSGAIAHHLRVTALVILAFVAWGSAASAQTPSFTISTYANTFIPTGGNQTTLARPGGVAADANGNIYIADTGNCVVWGFPGTGGEPFVLADEPGNCTRSYANSTPTLDSLNHPVDRLSRSLWSLRLVVKARDYRETD